MLEDVDGNDELEKIVFELQLFRVHDLIFRVGISNARFFYCVLRDVNAIFVLVAPEILKQIPIGATDFQDCISRYGVPSYEVCPEFPFKALLFVVLEVVFPVRRHACTSFAELL